MFVFALFIGVYSYLIFSLGTLSLLTIENIWIVSFIWVIALIIAEHKALVSLPDNIRKIRFKLTVGNWLIYLLLILFILQAFINLIGALGPELAYDALWYHLTFPKLYLQHHAIYHISSSLLYYSDMPKLGETLYVGALTFGNEITAKLEHYFFGLLVVLVLYKFSRRIFNQKLSLLIVVIFYSNLVVDWESITAYIDLIRTFFEFLSLWGLINWYESHSSKWLIVSGLLIGLAISTKLLAIGSFLILLALLFFINISKRKTVKDLVFNCFIFSFFSFLIPLPWLLFSYMHTGNPVFPFFTSAYEISANSPSPFKIIPDLWDLFIHSADPISPIYLIFLPLIIIFYKRLKKEMKIIVWYCGLSIILWYFTPRTGGGRFILPYLPAFSIICGAIYSEILKKTGKEWRYISYLLLVTIILVSTVAIGYRGVANKKYLPVILGTETKGEFLSNNLNFHYGDFYDSDNYFAKHIKPNDTVLLYGFHNLYYADFPYIDYTWAKKGDKFDYIAVQDMQIVPKYKNWQLIYSNDKTMVQLFKPPKEECPNLCSY